MANFHPDLYGWLVKNWNTEPEKAEKLQNFLGFASLIECQVYPVNAKYHMQLEGININLHTRSRDQQAFTGANRKEIEQLYALERLVTQGVTQGDGGFVFI
jgi:4-hydroxy-tetrahydrodipicolinate synthase